APRNSETPSQPPSRRRGHRTSAAGDPQLLAHLGDVSRARPLPRVRDKPETRPPGKLEGLPEAPRRRRGLIPTEPHGDQTLRPMPRGLLDDLLEPARPPQAPSVGYERGLRTSRVARSATRRREPSHDRRQ